MMISIYITFTPADGSTPRTITLSISDVRQEPDRHSWSAHIDVLGFRHDDSLRVHQVDWANVIRAGADMIAMCVHDKIELEGGGTLGHEIYPRDFDTRMLELITTFTPADGSEPRKIT